MLPEKSEGLDSCNLPKIGLKSSIFQPMWPSNLMADSEKRQGTSSILFGRCPWKTIEHLCYAASSFVNHFMPFSEFSLELQSWNFQFGSKSAIFYSHVTLKFDEREREIKFIGLFENRGHRGPYSPYKLFNHNLYIGIIIFPHTDKPQYTGYDQP